MPLLASVLLTASDSGIGPHVSTRFAIASGIAITAVLLVILRQAELDPRRAVGIGVGSALGLAIVVGFAKDGYFRGRYDEGVGYGIGPAVQWAKDQSGERIAVAGTGGAFFQYGFYGDDLSNHVQYLGKEAPHGDFQPFESCDEWRRALNAGDYDYLVATGSLDLNRAERLRESTTFSWPQDDPAASLVLQSGGIAVYELTGELDPEGCPPSSL